MIIAYSKQVIHFCVILKKKDKKVYHLKERITLLWDWYGVHHKTKNRESKIQNSVGFDPGTTNFLQSLCQKAIDFHKYFLDHIHKLLYRTQFVLNVLLLHCKNSGVKFNTPGVVRGPHQVGVNFNTSRC